MPSDPPTVLYLVDYTGLGGGETSLINLLERLAQPDAPWRAHVVVPERSPVSEAIAALGVPVEVVPYPRRLRRGPLPVYSLGARRALDRIVEGTRPALIHAWHAFGLLYAGPAARRRGLPVVWTCHGSFEAENPAVRTIARRYATRAACVSDTVRASLARFMPEPGFARTHYLGLAPFEPHTDQPAGREAIRAELDEPPARPLIGVVGRFQPIKGHQHLLDALPRIIAAVPELGVWFMGDAMFGSEEEARHKALIERRVQAEGLAGHVRFLGFRPDARRLLRALDAVVIPSEYESFSMVSVEGLEAGIPVVGPDGWGPREIIEVPANGLRFEPGRADALASAVIETLLHRGEAALFDPAAGPRRVAEAFSVEAQLRRLDRLYRELAPGAFAVPPPPA